MNYFDRLQHVEYVSLIRFTIAATRSLLQKRYIIKRHVKNKAITIDIIIIFLMNSIFGSNLSVVVPSLLTPLTPFLLLRLVCDLGLFFFQSDSLKLLITLKI